MSTDINPSSPQPKKIGPIASGLLSAILYLSLLCVVIKLVGCSVDSVRQIGHGKITEAQLQRCPIDGPCLPSSSSSPASTPDAKPMKRPSGDVMPWESAVRIRIKADKSETSGSGTIVVGSPERSIVLTCAHLFRGKSQATPKTFALPIFVDLFNGKFKAEYLETVIGSCIDFDLARDVALIEIRPNRPLKASIVAIGWRPVLGEMYFAVGCTRGNYPTTWAVANVGSFGGLVGKYRAISTTYPPIEGRSGGGLYLADDGRLVGVCTGHADGIGLYAETASIKRIFETNGLTELTTSPPSGDRIPRANIEPPTAIDSTVPIGSGKVQGLTLPSQLDLGHIVLGGGALVGIWQWLKHAALARLTSGQCVQASPLVTELDTRVAKASPHDPIMDLVAELRKQRLAKEDEAKAKAAAQEVIELAGKIKAVVDPTSTANADGK